MLLFDKLSSNLQPTLFGVCVLMITQLLSKPSIGYIWPQTKTSILASITFMNSHLGHQTLLELYACKKQLLNNREAIQKILTEAAEVAQATIVKEYFHQFSPYGISGTLVITESHINIHTWPEHNFVAVDFFTCNRDMKIKEACTFLTDIFDAKEYKIFDHPRGSKAIIQKLHG